ncbi:MAG: phosphate signaling complex protein PhoU [Actinomycetota bacterium]
MVRVSFHEELGIAEQELLGEGGLVRKQIERVLEAVARRDVDLAARVIEEDDRVDEVYLAAEERILNVLALQAPVAGDLRLVSAILHSNMHVERIGDLCVNIAKFVQNQDPYPSNSPMVTRLQEMGGHAIGMLDTALSAFAQRSAELAEELPGRDNALDRLNRGMLDDLKDYVDDESFEWATKLILVSRYLERMGDHAVDIGEQVAFLVTGVFREFTDASHPEKAPRA